MTALLLAMLCIAFVGPTVTTVHRSPSMLRVVLALVAGCSAAGMLAGLGLSGFDGTVAVVVVNVPAGLLALGSRRMATPVVTAAAVFFPIAFGSLAFVGDPNGVWVALWAASICGLLLVTRNDTAANRAAGTGRRRVAEQLGALAVVAVLVVVLGPALSSLVGSVDTSFDPSGNRTDPTLADAAPYWGFQDVLDTSVRGDLSDTEMLRVRSDVPSFWRGQVFDTWDGRVWTQSDRDMRPEVVAEAQALADRRLVQVVEVRQPLGDVVFGATQIAGVEGIPAIEWEAGGAVRSATGGLPAGTTYRVTSVLADTSSDRLRAAGDFRLVPPAIGDYAIPLPMTERVEDLAVSLTRDQPTTYDKVRALESWIADNITYDLDSPVPGQAVDAVDDMLFVHRRGFCEQIGSALTVMARAVGIPARLAVGYVPSERDDFRGEWISRASDAHAWVEVWFPNVGWVGFDPTADVPLSGEYEPNDYGALLLRVVFIVAAIGITIGALALARRARSRRRTATPVDTLLARFDGLGAHRGGRRAASETLDEYATRLAAEAGDDGPRTLAAAFDGHLYAGRGLDRAAIEAELDRQQRLLDADRV